MSSMKKGDITTTFLIVVGAWLTLMTVVVVGIDTKAISPVFASVNRSILLLTDLHLEECIKQLQLGNTEDALDHCQLADQELEVVMKNITVNR
jgi:hypothetical protein